MWTVRPAEHKEDGVLWWAVDNGLDTPDYYRSYCVAQAIADARNNI